MTLPTPLLIIEDLYVSFATGKTQVPVLCGVDLLIHRGETVGLLGESGSGKSVTALAVLGLLGAAGRITNGLIDFDGTPLHYASASEFQKIRGKRIGMIFQDPGRSLNPTLSIGYQLSEILKLHTGLNSTQAKAKTIELLSRVGIADPQSRVDAYPFQLSGGMCQRVAIAMALACGPDLLIADEPTTALDVTVQAQILSLLKDIQSEYGTGILLITHDLGVVAAICDRVSVMNGGKIVEDATVDALFNEPQHPYSYALLQAKREVEV